jgi:hypothetical protein
VPRGSSGPELPGQPRGVQGTFGDDIFGLRHRVRRWR